MCKIKTGFIVQLFVQLILKLISGWSKLNVYLYFSFSSFFYKQFLLLGLGYNIYGISFSCVRHIY